MEYGSHSFFAGSPAFSSMWITCPRSCSPSQASASPGDYRTQHFLSWAVLAAPTMEIYYTGILNNEEMDCEPPGEKVLYRVIRTFSIALIDLIYTVSPVFDFRRVG